MEHTPTGCGSDLPSILGSLENVKTSRSVSNSLQRLHLDSNSIQNCWCRPKLRPDIVLHCLIFVTFVPVNHGKAKI